MTLKRVTAPTEPAVSLADFKSHINNGADDQDADLQLKLDAAIAHVENDLRRCLVTSTFDLYLSDWPCRGYIDIPLGNLQAVEHIKYTDSAGVLITVSPGIFKVARGYSTADADMVPPWIGDGPLDAGIGRVYLAYGQSWPSAALDTGEPIAIRFTCGWDGAANVPTPIKQRILMLAAHWYRNRDAVVVGTSGNATSAEVALCGERLTYVFEDRRFL